MLVLAIMIAFLLPIILSLTVKTSLIGLWLDRSRGLLPALYRSSLFALASSFVNTFLGLQIAIFLRRIPFDSSKLTVSSLLSVLVLPILLGNVTISYIFKCSLYGSTFFSCLISGERWAQFASLLLIQFWQYGLLFVYLFWLSIRQIPNSKYMYALSVEMTDREIIRDIIIPSIRILFILLFVINFVFTFYESAKCQFIFKMSQGQDTELISQALFRVHQSLSVVNPVTSQAMTLKSGLLITLLAMILVTASAYFLNMSFKSLRNKPIHFLGLSANQGKIIAILCVMGTLAPIAVALMKSNYAFSIDYVREILIPLAMTVISAIFASALAIIFGIAYRMILNKHSKVFSMKSVLLLLSVILLQLIPPICVMICGYKWMSIVGYSGIVPYVIWIWGHPILTFPLLASFIIATHLIVNSDEIDWLDVHRMTRRDIVKYSFQKRFRKDYMLTFLFAFSFIWNDVTLNKVLSDKIPSFADKMQRLFVGRATNDAQATLYALIAIIIALMCLSLWHSVIKRISKVK